MCCYVDTSVIVKLYIKEALSLEASNWVRARNEAIPLTVFHELEFKNALYLKQFRTEITDTEIRAILLKFADHQKRGVYYRPPVNWSDIMIRAVEIACTHTNKTGARSLDVLHVAAALTIKAGSFLTLDDRQATLAALVGLKLEDCTQSLDTPRH
ncbi:MAG: type II toxin-antitoxin system VapC family toxin [Deltaproteobacteria bacterium]|nr:type II toxin-antitoxin system VapC family toxin [Deltaproteobacteria bacterium]